MPKRKLFYSIAFAISMSIAFLLILSFATSSQKPLGQHHSTNVIGSTATNSYNRYGLSDSVLHLALKGYGKLKAAGKVTKDIICICDFNQPSSNERLYVIDLSKGKLLYNTLVAHGRNSGNEYARSFSNVASSNKSSLGFYTTEQTYIGEHGLSLKLKGCEKGFNDNAEERAIVVHGASYVDCSFIEQNGRLGRSFGCPSIPYSLHRPIIEAIKNGGCLFIFYPDKNYLASSKLLR